MICAGAIASVFVVLSPAHAKIDDKTVEAHLTPLVAACERAPENGGTLPQAICWRDELGRQDRRLNDTWARVINRLPLTRQVALRQSERQWIKQRDATCKDEASDYINSTAAYMYNVCAAKETIRRMIWLEAIR